MKNMKINSCYFPYKINNPYGENIKDILRSKNIETTSLKKCLLSLKTFKNTHIFNLNWFENIESSSKIKAIFEYSYKCMILKLIKLGRKKIIFTLHNKLAHNTISTKLSKKMMKKLAKSADRIVIMCDDSFDVLKELSSEKNLLNKVVKIEHPNYVRNYKNSEFNSLRNQYKLNDELVFLFIGSIAPYKNIELLIKIFNEIKDEKVKLIIAGKPVNNEYKNDILNSITNQSNIITKFEYIPDEEIGNLYQTCDIVVLPYNKNNSLNSGSIYLSFTFGKTVISPNIGTINDLNDKSFVFSYDYNSNEEHLENLTIAINKVYNEFKNNKKNLDYKGKKALNYINKYHNDDEIAKKYENLYKSLV